MNSPVQIKCAVRGERLPAIPERLPEVYFRVGVDLNPINVRDAEASLWLRAFVWPEHEERAELLRRAIEVAQQAPPRLIAGDAVDVLPGILAEVPKDTTLCIFRTFTALPQNAREQLSILFSQYGVKRDLFLVSTRPHSRIESQLRLVSFENGVKIERLLAHCQNHGEWVEWLD